MLLLLLALLLPPGAPEGETSGGWAAQPHVALAKTRPGAPAGPLILENFDLPAAPSGSGHVPATLSAPNASRQDRSRPRSHVPPNSHRPAGTHRLDTRAKDLLRQQVDPVTDTAKAPQGLWAARLRLVRLAGGLWKHWPKDKYKRFLEKHVDESRNWSLTDTNYCNEKLEGADVNRRRKPCGWSGPKCKAINTFIHDSAERVLAVCNSKVWEKRADNYYLSQGIFNLTVCRRECLSVKPPCYYKGENIRARVLLACEDEMPVHFECHTEEEPIALGQSQP